MSEGHTGFISNWKQLLAVGVLAFVVPVFLIIAVVQLITGGMRTGDDSDQAVASRIKPVGEVNVVVASAPAGSRSGEEVYQATCSACHAAGLLSAPKPGDKQAWAARIAQGEKTLIAHAIGGIRAMPARGGNASLGDEEIARAVVWMANQSGASFKAPAAAPTPVAAAPAPPPAAEPAPAAAAAQAARAGEQVFQQACVACHGAGVMGAPKVGDAAAWKPRIAQGKPVLYDHALKGIRAMPAKGGNAALPDAEVKAAVDYMVAQAK